MKSDDWLRIIVLIAMCSGIVVGAFVIFSSAPTMKETYNEIYINGELPHHDDMTYMPHYVRFHIVPEEPGLAVITKMEGSSYSEIWTTDSNSEIVIEMVSVKRYKVDIHGHSYFIYPSGSEYTIMTEKIG